MIFTELEKLCRTAYGAYEYLRDHDLAAESGTSKRLRSGDSAKLKARVVEEMHELKGVIEGTHFHEGFEKDIILEGYEVWYWVASLTVAQHVSYDALQPHLSLAAGFQRSTAQRETILKTIPALITTIQQTPVDKAQTIALCGEVLKFVGFACALNQTPPDRLLERDIEEMRQKAYLSEYWRVVSK